MSTISHLSTNFLLVQICIFILLQIHLVYTTEILQGRVSGIKCTYDATVYKGFARCYLNATRDRRKLSTIQYNLLEPANDIWVHLTVYYKYTMGYRPWMVNYESNYCNVLKGIETPNLVNSLILKGLKQHAPGLIHKCPFFGWSGIKDVDLPAVLNAIVPQVIPAGEYRVMFRFHISDNRTFMTAIISGTCDSINPLDRMRMGRK